ITPGARAYSSVGRFGGPQEPAVPDAGVGDNDTRPPGVLLDLPPELADEHAQHIDITFIPRPPHAVEEPVVGQQLARMLGKGLDQRPFRLRQADLRTVPGDRVAREVDVQAAAADAKRARR